MEVKHIGKEQFHELVVGDYFRVCNKTFVVSIDREYLQVKNEAIADGLNVEKAFVGADGKKLYTAVLSIGWDNENNRVILREDAADLMGVIKGLNNEITDEITFRAVVEELINSYDFAIQALKDIHEVK